MEVTLKLLYLINKMKLTLYLTLLLIGLFVLTVYSTTLKIAVFIWTIIFLSKIKL